MLGGFFGGFNQGTELGRRHEHARSIRGGMTKPVVETASTTALREMVPQRGRCYLMRCDRRKAPT